MIRRAVFSLYELENSSRFSATYRYKFNEFHNLFQWNNMIRYFSFLFRNRDTKKSWFINSIHI